MTTEIMSDFSNKLPPRSNKGLMMNMQISDCSFIWTEDVSSRVGPQPLHPQSGPLCFCSQTTGPQPQKSGAKATTTLCWSSAKNCLQYTWAKENPNLNRWAAQHSLSPIQRWQNKCSARTKQCPLETSKRPVHRGVAVSFHLKVVFKKLL